MLFEVKKKDLRVQNTTFILGGRGWGRQGKEITISTMQKGAILRKCVNTFVPHCSLNIYEICLFSPILYFIANEPSERRRSDGEAAAE